MPLFGLLLLLIGMGLGYLLRMHVEKVQALRKAAAAGEVKRVGDMVKS